MTKEQEAQQAQDAKILKQIERMNIDFLQGKWVPPAWAEWFRARRK